MDRNVNLSERRKGLPCRTERETDARLFCTAAQPVQNAQDALNIDRGILTSCQVRSEHHILFFFFYFNFRGIQAAIHTPLLILELEYVGYLKFNHIHNGHGCRDTTKGNKETSVVPFVTRLCKGRGLSSALWHMIIIEDPLPPVVFGGNDYSSTSIVLHRVST